MKTMSVVRSASCVLVGIINRDDELSEAPKTPGNVVPHSHDFNGGMMTEPAVHLVLKRLGAEGARPQGLPLGEYLHFHNMIGSDVIDSLLGYRLGSGDDEREASMTRQIPYEPLPAPVRRVRFHYSDVQALTRQRHGLIAAVASSQETRQRRQRQAQTNRGAAGWGTLPKK